MKRLAIVILNFILLIIGFLIVYSNPLSALAITFGMLLISASIISFAFLIYFPPTHEYVKLNVVEEGSETPKTPSKIAKRPKKIRKTVKRPKRKKRR